MHIGALLLITLIILVYLGPGAVLRAVAGLGCLLPARRDRPAPTLGSQPNTGSVDGESPALRLELRPRACSGPHPINLGIKQL